MRIKSARQWLQGFDKFYNSRVDKSKPTPVLLRTELKVEYIKQIIRESRKRGMWDALRLVSDPFERQDIIDELSNIK